MKKHLFILGFAMLLSVAGAFAQGGTTGPLTWELNNGTLTISGSGAMPNYSMGPGMTPWIEYTESIKSIAIESGVTHIGDLAFAFCEFCTTIAIPNTLTSIGSQAFFHCSDLTSIPIPNSVTTIGYLAFSGCSGLTSVTLPNSITDIPWGTFRGCGLTSITLPSSISSIADEAFEECSSLTLIYNFRSIPVSISSSVFSGVNISVCELRVPADEVPRYQNADVWKSFYIVGCYLVKVAANDDEYGFVSGDDFYKANATATVTATAYSGYKFVNWTKDDAVISTDNPYNFTVTEDIELVANFEETVGIAETDNYPSLLQIYPNPTSGELWVDCRDAINRVSTMTPITGIAIFDVMGRSVLVETQCIASLQSQIGQSQCEINISHLPAGVYFIRITTDDSVVTRKVVKQ